MEQGQCLFAKCHLHKFGKIRKVGLEEHIYIITYLPHKAAAEVSKDKEPIGRGCVEFKWFESHVMSDPSEVISK